MALVVLPLLPSGPYGPWGGIRPRELWALVLFFSGLLLISNGIQGEYIARIFEEVKGRPLYVVGKKFGFAEVVASRELAPVKSDKGEKSAAREAS